MTRARMEVVPAYGTEFVDARQAVEQLVADHARDLATHLDQLERLYRQAPDHNTDADRQVLLAHLAELRHSATFQVALAFDLAIDGTQQRPWGPR